MKLKMAPGETDRSQTLISASQVRSDINDALSDFFDAEHQKANAISPAYGVLWTAIHDLIMNGGKRFRPYLTVLSYQACGGQEYAKIIPVAVSQELLHASVLIHDDIIDRDFIRYGRENISGTFLKRYATLTSQETAMHYAQSAALLAGDLTLSAAHHHLALSNFTDDQKRRALHIFNAGMFEVAGGELLDTEATLYKPEATNSLVVDRYKTAGYSIIAPLSIGAVMAGADDTMIASLHAIGEPLGIAYQLADDMLSMFGDETVVGKPLLSDLHEGKRTYLVQTALRLASAKDRATILDALGNPNATLEHLASVRAIAEQNGAKAFVEEKITAYEQQGLAVLATLDISPAAAEAFRQFIAHALRRNA